MRPGTRADFAELTAPFHTELLAHCHRMLGSRQEAEDQLQETYLRAWRSFADFEGRSSLRTWLYRIATNVCLTALEGRGRLPMPTELDRSDRPLFADQADLGDPADITVARDQQTRALLVAWQHLSARQRAVLILRDVLCWSATEIAALLDTSDSAVHSMVRRARAQLAGRAGGTGGSGETDNAGDAATPDPAHRRLLADYATAFETGDVAALVHMVTRDVVCERKPSATVDTGRDALRRILAHCPAIGNCAMVPISVNDRPGFGVYRADGDGVFRAHTIDVLTVTDSGFTRIEVLEDRSLFATFGLPRIHIG